jgi:hypothetical protein
MAPNMPVPSVLSRCEKKSALEHAMSFHNDSDQARERMLKAEENLRHYLEGGVFNLEMEKQLSEAANAAREEFIDHLASLWPESRS